MKWDMPEWLYGSPIFAGVMAKEVCGVAISTSQQAQMSVAPPQTVPSIEPITGTDKLRIRSRSFTKESSQLKGSWNLLPPILWALEPSTLLKSRTSWPELQTLTPGEERKITTRTPAEQQRSNRALNSSQTCWLKAFRLVSLHMVMIPIKPWTSISTTDFPPIDPELCRWMVGATGGTSLSGIFSGATGRCRTCSRASSKTNVAPGALFTAAQAPSDKLKKS